MTRGTARQQQLAADLKACRTGASDAFTHGSRVLLALSVAAEPVERRVLERVLNEVVPYSIAPLRKLPAAYLALAHARLAKTKTPGATFVRAYGAATDVAMLQGAAAWWHAAFGVGAKAKHHAKFQALARDARGLAAARAVAVALDDVR